MLQADNQRQQPGADTGCTLIFRLYFLLSGRGFSQYSNNV